MEQMNGRLKFKAADNLAPMRNRIVDLVANDARVIEFGCGNGDLLFKLAPQIEYGLGIDTSRARIGYARKQKETGQISNIDFKCEKLDKCYEVSAEYDFSIASLFFHVIPLSDSVHLISKMIEISDTVLICGFSRPERFPQKVLVWLDQRFTSHFANFKAHQKFGYLEGLFERFPGMSITRYNTVLPFIKIYKLQKK